MNPLKLYKKIAARISPWNRFFIIECLIVMAFGFGLFYAIIMRTETIMNDDILGRARSYVTQITLARKWNADYGGVYTIRETGAVSTVTAGSVLRTADGKILTLCNPSLMIREMSRSSESRGLYAFHVSSLTPVNPDNAPDEFERNALSVFKSGNRSEKFITSKNGSKAEFRYMVPLLTEQSCLGCHEERSFKVGDLRGGLSVQFDITPIRSVMFSHRLAIAVFILTLAAVVILLVYHFLGRLRSHIRAAEENIRKMVITDELTGLFNRRYFMDRMQHESARTRRSKIEFSVAIIDIDYFKNINDTFGHLAGDAVLREVANRIRGSVRSMDIVARYGGEEFGVILPFAGSDEAYLVAERIRKAFAGVPIPADGEKDIKVTVSIGVSTVHPDTEVIHVEEGSSVIKSADDALYKAKRSGRNRVVIADESGLQKTEPV